MLTTFGVQINQSSNMYIAVTHYGMSLTTINNTGHILSPRNVINSRWRCSNKIHSFNNTAYYI